MPDCTGQTNCIQSAAPIQAAVNYFAAHSAEIATPDRTIYVEGGTFKENVTIRDLNNLSLLGAADGKTTILDGLFTIINSIGINLSQFTVNKGIAVNSSQNVNISNVATNAAIQVADSKNVTVKDSTVSTAAPAPSINIARSDTVTIQNVTNDERETRVRAEDSRNLNVTAAYVANRLTVETNGVEHLTIQGGAGNDALTLIGSNVSGAVNIYGGAGDDVLTIDNSLGVVVPMGDRLFFDGGADFDALVLRGGSFNQVAYYAFGPSSGIIDLDGARVAYQNIEPIADTTTAANVTLPTPASNVADTITISSGPVVNGFQTMLITSGGTFESIAFANKANVIVDGAGGNDSITLDTTQKAAGLVSLTITGGDGTDSLAIANVPSDITFTISTIETVTGAQGAITNGITNGLQTLVGRVALLDDSGALETKLPVVGVTYSQTLDMQSAFDKFRERVNAYVTGDTSPTIFELAANLTGWSTIVDVVQVSVSNVSGIRRSDGKLEIALVFNASKTQNVTLDLGPESLLQLEDFSVRFTNPTVSLTTAANLDFNFGLDGSAFYLRSNSFVASFDIDANNLATDVEIGFLGAQVQNGLFNLDADVALTPKDADGTITSSELNTLVFTQTTSGALNATLPVNVRAGFAASFNPNGAALTLASTDPFFVKPTITSNDAYDANFKPFTTLLPVDALNMLKSLDARLDSLSDSYAFDVALPLVGDTRLRHLFNFGTAFEKHALNYLAPSVITSGDITAYTLSSNASFTLTIDSRVVPITLAFGNTTGNSNLDALKTDLQNAINAALAGTAYAGKLTVGTSDAKLTLTTDVNSGIGELRFTAVETDSAVTGLGFNKEDSGSVNGTPVFKNVQELLTNLSARLGYPVTASYDAASRALTFNLDLQHTFTPVSSKFQFPITATLGSDMGELADLASDGSMTFTATVGFDFNFGIDLNPTTTPRFVAEIKLGDDADGDGSPDVLPSPTPRNGILSAAAHFTLTVDGASYAITVLPDSRNTSIGDLAADIQAAIDAKLPNKIGVGTLGDHIGFEAKDSSISILRFDAQETDTAVSQLGLTTTLTSRARSTNWFLDDARFELSVTGAATNIAATARYGFVGLALNDGDATFRGSVALTLHAPGDPTNHKIYGTDFANNLADPETDPEAPQVVTGTLDHIAVFTATNASMAVTFHHIVVSPALEGLLADSDAKVQLNVADWYAAPTAVAVVPFALDSLAVLRNVTFDTVIDALTQIKETLETLFDEIPILGANLPFINAPLNRIMYLPTFFEAFINTLKSNPVSTAQTFNSALLALLGLSTSALVFESDALKFKFPYTAIVSQGFPFDFDIDTLAPNRFSGGTADSFLSDVLGMVTPSADRLYGVGSAAEVNVAVTATLSLAFGLDVSQPATPAAFLYDGVDGMSMNIALVAKSEGMKFSARAAALTISVIGGAITIDGDGDPATSDAVAYTLHIADNGSGRHYLNQEIKGDVVASVSGAAKIQLPLFYPDEKHPMKYSYKCTDSAGNTVDCESEEEDDSFLSNIQKDAVNWIEYFSNLGADTNGDQIKDHLLIVRVANLDALFDDLIAGKSGDLVTVENTPDLAGLVDKSNTNILNLLLNPSLFIDGFDSLLQNIQESLDSVLQWLVVPLVGSKIRDSVRFIEDLRTDIVQKLSRMLQQNNAKSDPYQEINSSDFMTQTVLPSDAHFTLEINGAPIAVTLPVSRTTDNTQLELGDRIDALVANMQWAIDNALIGAGKRAGSIVVGSDFTFGDYRLRLSTQTGSNILSLKLQDQISDPAYTTLKFGTLVTATTVDPGGYNIINMIRTGLYTAFGPDGINALAEMKQCNKKESSAGIFDFFQNIKGNALGERDTEDAPECKDYTDYVSIITTSCAVLYSRHHTHSNSRM